MTQLITLGAIAFWPMPKRTVFGSAPRATRGPIASAAANAPVACSHCLLVSCTMCLLLGNGSALAAMRPMDDAMLEPPDRAVKHDSQHAEDDQRRKHSRDVGNRLRLRDHDTHTLLRAEKFGHDRAEQRI